MLGARPHAPWHHKTGCTSLSCTQGGAPSRAADAPHTFASALALFFVGRCGQMSTLFSKEGDPGKSWKLTRGPGGIRLYVPPTGKHKVGHNLDRLPANPAEKISKIIGVDIDDVPHELLDALRTAGEILQRSTAPSAKLFLVPPF